MHSISHAHCALLRLATVYRKQGHVVATTRDDSRRRRTGTVTAWKLVLRKQTLHQPGTAPSKHAAMSRCAPWKELSRAPVASLLRRDDCAGTFMRLLLAFTRHHVFTCHLTPFDRFSAPCCRRNGYLSAFMPSATAHIYCHRHRRCALRGRRGLQFSLASRNAQHPDHRQPSVDARCVKYFHLTCGMHEARSGDIIVPSHRRTRLLVPGTEKSSMASPTASCTVGVAGL
jgi:hypothetical protein